MERSARNQNRIHLPDPNQLSGYGLIRYDDGAVIRRVDEADSFPHPIDQVEIVWRSNAFDFNIQSAVSIQNDRFPDACQRLAYDPAGPYIAIDLFETGRNPASFPYSPQR
jgi:hypothetical protein